MDDKNKIIKALWEIYDQVRDDEVKEYQIADFISWGFTPEELRDALELDKDSLMFSWMKEIYNNKEEK